MSQPPKIWPNILFYFFFFLTSIPVSIFSQPIHSEIETLLKLKDIWGNTTFIQSWEPEIPSCQWPGIQCTNNTITGISLSNKNITDTIPAVICQLTNLIELDLSNNFIQGGFPTVLFNCSKLQTLDLSWNQFVGPLPNDIHKLSRLQYLDIGWNNFRGDIPRTIGQMTQLTTLYLVSNQFYGILPPELGNLLNLERLNVAFNRFVPRKVPEEFGRLLKLQYLWLSECNLIGEIPQSFTNLSSIKHLDLMGNNLVGGIPTRLLQLKNMTHLYIYNNKLSGEIPKTVEALDLKEIDLSDNSLTGAVPTEFGKLKKLETLHLFMNQLSGPLPAGLGKLPSVKSFRLYSNQLSGEIPSGLWTQQYITYLVLGDNLFSGNLPSQLSNSLVRLDISNNNFSGPIPSSIANWGNLSTLQAGNNHIWGNIPLELTALSNLSILELSGNHLYGQLPSRILSWVSLNTLNLANNNLSGQLPVALSSLPNLKTLKLSNNKFSGQIPAELGLLKLVTLDLSNNNLNGEIPSAFSSAAYQDSFFNNHNLCSHTQNLSIHLCSSHAHKHFSASYLTLISLPGMIILLVVVYFILIKFNAASQVNNNSEKQASIMVSFHILDFTEDDILNCLNEENVIGSGGSGKIYCIDINDSGSKVAVKRIWSKRSLSSDLEKQFRAEVEILGKIRHANVVKLLSCVSTQDSKLLVYEYMENYSLDRWLSKRKRMKESSSDHIPMLDWRRRLDIAIGAAKGLCYMHHDCSPPIIHRDIKSSNILLDADFNAKIADFGLAKMTLKMGEPYTASAVAGSFGYLAPEYLRTRRLNEKIDIYSFGVVLLELATGKDPCTGNDYLNLADWSWKHYCNDHPIIDAVDEDIKEPGFEECMVNMFKLGLMCTNMNPSSRPSMKRIVQMLVACNNQENVTRTQMSDEE